MIEKINLFLCLFSTKNYLRANFFGYEIRISNERTVENFNIKYINKFFIYLDIPPKSNKIILVDLNA